MNLEKQHYNSHNKAASVSATSSTANHAQHVNSDTNSNLDKLPFRIFLGTIILAPLVFWPSVSISQDFVKTFVIFFGTIVSTILLMLVLRKKQNISLPPKKIAIVGGLLVISLIISTLVGKNIDKSFFGQGFEISTTNFILTVFLGAFISYLFVVNRIQRAALVYIGIIGSFLGVVAFQIIRLVPVSNGTSILSLIKSNMLIVSGGWNSLGSFSLLVVLISIIALLTLNLSKKAKNIYKILTFAGLVSALIVGNMYSWIAMAIMIAFLAYQSFNGHLLSSSSENKSFRKKVSLALIVLSVVCVGFAWKGGAVFNKYIAMANPGYVEIAFPWKYTSQIMSDTLKDKPLFGLGPNHFGRAYLDYKPLELNLTQVWNAEFTTGFSVISTYFVTQGLVGGILWLSLIIVFTLFVLQVFRNLPSDSNHKFIVTASFSGALFMWVMMLLSTPSHSLVFYTFVLSGIALGSAVSCGILKSTKIDLNSNKKFIFSVFKKLPLLLIIICLVWGVFYVRQSIAIGYFASGFKSLTIKNDPDAAARAFNLAAKIDHSDMFWRAEVEALISKITQVVQSPIDGKQKPEDKALLITGMVNDTLVVARKAIAYDPNNYYNYISEGRIFEIATKLNMNGAVDAAIESYKNAIKSNPHSPALYLILSRFQASVNKLDDALQTAGAAIKEKQDYLEAIYLISQIQAAKGNMSDAITAAKVATQIDPNNPLLWFQLGVLNYNTKQYSDAVESFNKAITLVPEYSNAQYFLGLSYAYQGKTSMAIEMFKKLTVSNPDNQEVKIILKNLQSGQSPFTNTNSSTLVAPEKRSSLPIKEEN